MRKFFILFLILIISSGFANTNTKLTISSTDKYLYLDYVIFTDQNKITIPIYDLDKIVYINSLSDFNYYKTNNQITVNFFDNNKHTFILKYRTFPFSDNLIYLEKTIILENKLSDIKVNLNIDKNKITYIYPKTLSNINKGDILILNIKLKKESYDTRPFLAIFTAILLLIAISFSVFRKKIKHKKIDKKTKKGKLLTENENKIINLLKKQDGLMQQTLSEELEIPKANISKIINKLERKDLVERKQVGKIKKVFLK